MFVTFLLINIQTIIYVTSVTGQPPYIIRIYVEKHPIRATDTCSYAAQYHLNQSKPAYGILVL